MIKDTKLDYSGWIKTFNCINLLKKSKLDKDGLRNIKIVPILGNLNILREENQKHAIHPHEKLTKDERQ